MRIRVTQDDIDHGLQGNTVHCPIARVVSREAGMPARVTMQDISVYEDETALYRAIDLDPAERIDASVKCWETPEDARRFIRQFDTMMTSSPGMGRRLSEPFEFEL